MRYAYVFVSELEITHLPEYPNQFGFQTFSACMSVLLRWWIGCLQNCLRTNTGLAGNCTIMVTLLTPQLMYNATNYV